MSLEYYDQVEKWEKWLLNKRFEIVLIKNKSVYTICGK